MRSPCSRRRSPRSTPEASTSVTTGVVLVVRDRQGLRRRRGQARGVLPSAPAGTVNSLAGASTSLFSAVIVTIPVLDLIVSTWFALSSEVARHRWRDRRSPTPSPVVSSSVIVSVCDAGAARPVGSRRHNGGYRQLLGRGVDLLANCRRRHPSRSRPGSRRGFRLAVTVLAPPFSEIRRRKPAPASRPAWFSSSVIVRVCDAGAAKPEGPAVSAAGTVKLFGGGVDLFVLRRDRHHPRARPLTPP